MKNILLTITFLLGLNAVAQSPGENYVKTKVYKKASTIAIDTLVTIQYMDGLGRPMQTVAVKAGGTGKDIITPVVYDAYGREEKKYLPYVDTGINSPNYRPNTDLVQTADGLGLISGAYVNDYLGELSSTSPNPYSQTKFESSPLNRVLEQGAPGSSWAVSNNPSANHTVKFNYATNKSKELLYFTVAFEQQNNTDKYDSTTLQYNGWYPANELYVTITRDENWSGLETDSNALAKSGVIKEYKDKEGHLILKRVFNTDSNNVTEQLDTYYVYDDYGNLAYVIPPLASSQIVKTVFVRELSLRNYPWTKLTKVDETLADKYEHALNDYKNEDILNVDLQKEYGGSGGFSIYVDEDGNLTMSVNITTDDPMPYRNGAIVSIKEFGEFKDKEIGRISGSDYEYIFLIKDNQIVVVGSGKVPSVSTVLDDSSQLDYSGVFPFTKFVKMDAEEKEKIESKFYELIKAGETNPEIENSLNAQGIIAVSLTSTDVLSVSINVTAKDFISFESGASFDLPFERRIDDVVLGQAQGYTLRVRNNNLVIEGIGNFINFNFASSTPLTPSVVINSAVAESGLCYIYHYDDRNRLIEKFIPDNGWTQMIYDKLDRLRLSSDQKQQSTKTWMFTKYDCFDRPVYTGKYINLGFSGDRAAMQNYLDSVTILNEVREEGGTFANFDTVNYSNNTFPDWSLIDLVNYNQTPLDVQMVYYYDTYPDYEGVPDYYAPPAINSLGTSLTVKTLGLPTITQTRVIDQGYWVTDVTGYDDKARPVYQYTDNGYLNSKHKVESKLDFLGKPESVITTYQKGTLQSTNSRTWVTKTLKDDYTYDDTGRLLMQFQQVNNGAINLIAKNEYDKYGQLLKKYVGGVHPSGIFSAPIALQQVDYTYNIRGWLKGINSINGITSSSDDLFAFGINYNQPTHQGGIPLYNGNISETFWKYKQENNEKAYTYSYDGLNRLTNALYKEMTVNNQRYYEGPIHYDKNGNIIDLERFGFDPTDNSYKIIDQLSYHYNPLSNRLAKVDDTAGTTGFKDVNNGADDYAYDLNGNMVSDVNKGITEITYNHLNLPVKITFTGLQQNIEYVYSAAGIKLSKKVTNGRAITTTLYDNGFVFENNIL